MDRFTEHQRRLWQQMLQVISDHRANRMTFSAMVGNLEGALDAGDFKDAGIREQWYDVWTPLEIARATGSRRVRMSTNTYRRCRRISKTHSPLTVIAGENRAALRDETRLLEEYGGQPGTRQKITSSICTAADSVRIETHAYGNAVTGRSSFSLLLMEPAVDCEM